MCGIIGSVGILNHYKNVINGLKRLEYRGYDSSGVSYLVNHDIKMIKVPLMVENLIKQVRPFISENAIGHTRWATHGKISKENTHPFISFHGLFSLVHNGTIDNYLNLKEELIENGYQLEGETDSEVVVNYLEYLYLENFDLLKSLNLLDQKLKGSYSLVVIFRENSNLYFLKNQTSLLICKEKNGYLISSDLYAFNKSKINYFELQDHQYGFINQNECCVYLNNQVQNVLFSQITIDIEPLDQINCYLEKEIFECPKVLEYEINHYINNNQVIIDEEIIDKLKKASKITIIGCGTSYHAGLTFKRFSLHPNIEVKLASEFIYEKNIFDNNEVFIVLSQSGETLDIIRSLDKVNDYFTIGITNNKESRIARMVKKHLDIMVKKEISVASTKAYFGEVVLLYLLNAKINNSSLNDIQELPKNLNFVLNQSSKIKDIAKNVSKYSSLYFLGKGIDYDACKECSLKLKEITYIHSEAIPLGELKHGPLALINEKFPVIIIHSLPEFNKVIDLAKNEIKSRKGNIFQFELFKNNQLDFLLQVLFGDLLSLYVGRILNVNIDKPKNLAKSVTVE